jgi:hypothetical protein
MRPTHAFVLTTVLAAGSIGCEPFGNLDGDWTGGERGRTRWQTLDGLCPGLGGGCNFDVPLAVGARVTLAVDGIDGAPVTAAFTGGIEGAGGVQVDSESDTLVPIRVIAAGPGRTALSDSSGLLDAATVFGRTVTRLECGRWASGTAIDWRMASLVASDAITLPLTPRDETRPFTLACRASDDAGPLLSADAIEWTLVSGSEVLEVSSTGLILSPGSTARGARIEALTNDRGTAVVRAQIGDVSRELTITIE